MLLKTMSPAPLLMLAVVTVFGILIGACTSQNPGNTEETPVLSRPPSTTFPMPPVDALAEMGWVLSDGRRETLADYKGKILVLDFYATWCAPCRQSIPRLITWHRSHESQDLKVVGLNVGGADDRIKVAAFQSELGITYPLGFPDKALTDLFLSDNQKIPQTFVFGRDGELRQRFIGYDPTIEAELEKVIGETLDRRQ